MHDYFTILSQLLHNSDIFSLTTPILCDTIAGKLEISLPMILELLEKYLILRKQLREDIFFLCHILGYDLIVRLHSDYHAVGLYNRRTNPFTLTALPRGTYKTSFFTIVESIQDILNNPNIRILLCHYAGQNARDMLDELQNHFIANDELRFLFPDIVPQNTKRPETDNWTTESITIRRTKHYKEGTVEALGSDQTMASKHYDKIKFDDLVVEQSTTTVDQIKKATSFLLKSYSLLNNHNPERNLSIVGTEWVPDDTMVQIREGKVLAPDGNPFKVFRVPAEDTDPETKQRRILFPEILSEEVLDGLKKSQSTTYHAFYLLDAEEFEDQIWGKAYISYYDDLPANKTFRMFGAIDPSISDTDLKNNCDTAVAIIGLDQTNELWLLDYKLGHGVDKIYDWFFELHEKWTSSTRVRKVSDGVAREKIGTFRFFSVETTLFQKLIAKELRVQMQKRNKWIPIRESKPVKEKMSRIMGALDGLIKNKAFHVHRNHQEAVTQIIRFGRPGQKVDLLDAVSQGYLEANLKVKTSARSNKQDEYEEMWAQARII